MNSLANFGRKLKLICMHPSTISMPRLVAFRLSHPFWLHLFYLVIVSVIGFVALRFSNPRSSASNSRPKDFDVFFTSVSSVTLSSMSTLEMEILSNAQLAVMTMLMFMGGEVFTSMLELYLSRSKYPPPHAIEFELDLSAHTYPVLHESDNGKSYVRDPEVGTKPSRNNNGKDILKHHDSLRYLGYVVMGYLLVVHGVGATLVSMYVSVVGSASEVLNNKGLKLQTFAIFTTVATFANCGFVPTNENMMAFTKNSGLLLILIPQVLIGNTLYPSCLRAVIWFLEKFTKKEEFSHLLKNYGEFGYGYLLSGYHCLCLTATAFGFIFVQLTLFMSMEWNSKALKGLNPYQKFVGSLFQVVNSRHTGETIVDLSLVSPAVLVLFLLMMYLPPHTCFLPAKCGQQHASGKSDQQSKKRQRTFSESLILPQLTYLVAFIILACITERDNLKQDPLNFNVFSITIEVISAYGNVGFSTGYSCERQIKPHENCQDKYYGFVGRWSGKGKVVLIIVMLFGRLKKFNQRRAKAWKLK